MFFFGWLAPGASLIIFLFVYLYFGFSFVLPKIFILLRLYQNLNEYLFWFPEFMKEYTNFKVVTKRLDDFFKTEELKIHKITEKVVNNY